jgi:hypothetical protein
MNGKDSYGEVVIGKTTYDASGKMTGTLVTVIPQCFDKWRPEDDDSSEAVAPLPTHQQLYPRLFPKGELRKAHELMRLTYKGRGLLLPWYHGQVQVQAPNFRRLQLNELTRDERQLMAYNRVLAYWDTLPTIRDEESCKLALIQAFSDVDEIYVVP